jgi:colanic acid/amylovoran biosynthesis glycosyltransferase
MVARFVEKKGHRTLLKALRLLPHEYVAWFVGTGPLDVARLADSYGVVDRVRILGRLSDTDLKATYRAATLFCLPSETASSGDREGIPVSLMEAMSYGLPVITTRHAGIPELVPEILIEEGDAVGLAHEIQRVGQDPRLRKVLGQRNRELVSARFSPANVNRLIALFGEWAM